MIFVASVASKIPRFFVYSLKWKCLQIISTTNYSIRIAHTITYKLENKTFSLWQAGVSWAGEDSTISLFLSSSAFLGLFRWDFLSLFLSCVSSNMSWETFYQVEFNSFASKWIFWLFLLKTLCLFLLIFYWDGRGRPQIITKIAYGAWTKLQFLIYGGTRRGKTIHHFEADIM